jgi:hypothetical protein
MMKSKGPSTGPWGTPCIIAAESELWPLRKMFERYTIYT